MRRPLLILAAIVVLLGSAYAFYAIFSSRTPGVSVAPGGSVTLPEAPNGSLPSSPSSGSNIGTGTTDTESPGVATTVSARLVKISAGPVVPGEALLDIPAKNASSSPDVAVRYLERQSGNVFSYLMRAKTITRTSNRTLPGGQSALWLPGASAAIVRYLSGSDFSTINSYVLPANGSEGFFLPQNLAGVDASSAGILVLSSGAAGSVASLEHTDGTKAARVFSTPLSSARISFAGKNQYLLFAKPSATLPGDAFLVSRAGALTHLAGPLSGLVALSSPSGAWVLVSYTLSGTLQTELVNAKTGTVVPLPVATIADKCAWTADSAAVYCGVPQDPPSGYSYPDDWYQGAVSFSDRIWRIDVVSRYAQLVLDAQKEIGAPVDATALSLDPNATALSFVNKIDGSLWLYEL